MQNDLFKVDLYIRVSTDRQAKEGDSLEEQEKELKKFCEYRQFQIRHIYIEKGKSGKNTNRPEYKKLIKDVATGKINAVVVKQLDRLSRSLLDFEQFILLLQKHNVEFISLKENFDTTFAMGKAMFRVALVFAQLEREQNSERVLDVMAFRAEQGLSNGGRTPFGYVTVNKERATYKKEKQIVELIYEKFFENKSTTETAKFLNDTGCLNRNNKLWDKRHIQWILQNHVYIGKMRWKGEIFQATHPPIISEELFNKIQEIFSSRRHIRNSKKIGGLLRGILFCVCGSEMKPNYTKKQNENKYYYYRCSSTMDMLRKVKCGNKYLNMDKTNQQIISAILEYAEENHLSEIKAKIKAHNTKVKKNIAVYELKLQELEKQLKEVKAKQEKYLDSLISHQFTIQERQLINSKLEEFSLQEKQIQAQIYKQRFELAKKFDALLSVEDLKKSLIFFKVNHQLLTEKELVKWFNENISKIIYQSEKKVIINFKLLDKIVG